MKSEKNQNFNADPACQATSLISLSAEPQSLTLSPDIAISIRNLSKKFKLYDSPQHRLKEALNPFRKKYHRDFWALKDLSFEVKKGESIGIIGRNGSGKSTLLQLIAGTLTPSGGSIKVNGRISALLELGSGFNPEFTGMQNIYFSGSIIGFTKEEMDAKLEEIVSFADIGDFIDQPVKTYSSGMYVRLAFSAAISVNPEILIVDEALSVGDIFFQQKCHEKIEELIRGGITVMIVSHDMRAVEKYCDKAILLDRGICLFIGPPNEAVHRYAALVHAERLLSAPAESPREKATASTSVRNFSAVDDWPSPDSFLDLSSAVVIGRDDIVKLLGVAVCNERGEACRSFSIGEIVYVYMEFEVLQDIEVPIAGLEIINNFNIKIHSKSSLHYMAEAPVAVRRGARVRFRQTMQLQLGPGDYTVIVAFATMTSHDYEHASEYSGSQLHSKIIPIMRVSNIFPLQIKERTAGLAIPFYGYVDLPGNAVCEIPSDNKRDHAPQKKSAGSPEKKEVPTLFHVTHWKAGSQWIYKIFRECMPDSVITGEVNEVQFLKRPIERGKVYSPLYVTKEQFYSVALPKDYKSFLIIRDLRDTLISGYYSIKKSHGILHDLMMKWRTTVNSLNLEDGLMYMMDEWLPYSVRIQESWLNSGIKTIRYEDLLEDDIEILGDLFLGELNLPIAPEQLKEIVLNNRFEQLTRGRSRGTEDSSQHERKGIAGDWENYFTVGLTREFKKRHGKLLINTGYERDEDWR